MRLAILSAICACAFASPLFAQGVGDAGDGGGGGRANYDYSIHFPGDLPNGGFPVASSRPAPQPRAHPSRPRRG
jgi:hypothetical protein